MTLIPAGAQLAPVDLPPPPPASDPREPSPTTVIRGRTSRTPQRARSPGPANHSHSRGSSPTRPPVNRSISSEHHVPIVQPIPKPISGAAPSNCLPINPLTHHSSSHLSRPSSPSSIHSSSSAIFERDIELPAVASLSLNPYPPTPHHTLNHKSSRLSHLSHGSPLDHSVPAVLDDAVEALAGADTHSRGMEGFEIEAPAPSGGMGMARQSSASLHGVGGRKVSTNPGGVAVLNSRSPSPVSLGSKRSSVVTSPAQSPPILGQLSTQQAQAQAQAQAMSGSNSGSTSPTSLMGSMSSLPRPAMPARMSTGPLLPGGWAFGAEPAARKVSDEAAMQPDEMSPTTVPPPGNSPSPPPAIPSHLSPTKDKRRISFISYNDLLLSVPTTVTPLGDITSGNLSPDHLPGTVSPSVPARSPVVPPPRISGGGLAGGLTSGLVAGSPPGKDLEHKGSWEAPGAGRLGGLGLGDGEWGREGLGKGLEQRLEDLVKEETLAGQTPIPAASTPASQAS